MKGVRDMQYSLKKVIDNYNFVRDLKNNRKPAVIAAPFVQWVGGKRRLIDKYESYFPKNFNNYFEPFVGGGSLFFYFVNKYANSKEYFLFDMNEELVITYNQIKNNWEEVQDLLNQMNEKHSKEFYYLIRNIDREKITERKYKKLFSVAKELTEVEIAARFLYLNITCFNAIFRVNREGLMNVPFGKTAAKNFGENGNLKLCSQSLSNANIYNVDFTNVETMAKPEDLVYFDPPYDPISDTSNFTDYTQEGFNFEDQVKLHDLGRRLKEKGVHVYISNSGTERIRNLYKDWNIQEFHLKRTLNSSAAKRKNEVEELLIF